MGSSAAHIILHDAEDSKTLVRTIVKLSVIYAGTSTTPQDFHMVIQRAESAVEIIAPSITQSLDQESPNALIAEDSSLTQLNSDTGMQVPYIWEVDLKGMRKLKKGDTISFSHISQEDAVHQIAGHVTLFFKE